MLNVTGKKQKTKAISPSTFYQTLINQDHKLDTRLFRIALVVAFHTALLCFAPMVVSLASPTVAAAINPVCTSAYRLVFLVSVSLAALSSGIRGGLLFCYLVSPFLILKSILDFEITGTLIDITAIGAAFLFSYIAGKHGEIQNTAQQAALALKYQSEQLRKEIAVRMQSEEKLKLKTTLLEAQSETSIDGILAVNSNREIILCNRRLQEMWRIPTHLLETGMYELVFRFMVSQAEDSPASRDFTGGLLGNQITEGRSQIRMADGRLFDAISSPLIDAAGTSQGQIWYFRDMTEQEEIQRNLIMTNRLASIGELASGIAHEINNPLTGIICYSQLIMEKNTDNNLKEDLEIIAGEAQRASYIIKDLLTFARKHDTEKQLYQINDIIESVLKIRSHEHKVNNIEVVKNLAAGLPVVMADYYQMQQVFLNIIINAEYFMVQENKRGRVTVTTQKVNDTVRCTLTDDGPGIAPENIRNIFNPFYTTKESGKGTGLGLSICHRIVTEHGGRIYVNSKPGSGASFIIELKVEAEVQSPHPGDTMPVSQTAHSPVPLHIFPDFRF